MGEVGGAEHPAALGAEGDCYSGEVDGSVFCRVGHVGCFGMRVGGCVDLMVRFAINYVLITHGPLVDITDIKMYMFSLSGRGE